MRAGVMNTDSVRLRLLLLVGLTVCLPVMVQSRQARPKAAVPAATAEGTTATNPQEVVEPDAVQQANPPVAASARKNVQNAAKAAGATAAKTVNNGATKVDAPASAEPPLPIVPPPAVTGLETSPAAETKTIMRNNAAGSSEKAELLAPTQGPGWAELIKTIGSVGLIVCLILAAYFLFRRFAPQYMAKRQGERDIRIVETLSMGEKRSIAVVQIGIQRLLLACTPGQIALLTMLNGSSGTPAADSPEIRESRSAPVFAGNFRALYEQEKKTLPARPSPVKALPPDIRGKMLELRKALEG